MTDDQRIEEIRRRCDARDADIERKRATPKDPCWGCRYRECDYPPVSGLCDCQHPLQPPLTRIRYARSESGLCGPNALLFRPSRLNPFKIAYYLMGYRA